MSYTDLSSSQAPEPSSRQSQQSLLTRPAGRVSWKWWLLWLFGFGVFSMIIPRDASYDVLHYHLHNGWSAFEGRQGFDLAPAELHSFLNPTWQIFTWSLIETLPGRGVAFVLGVFQGLILPVLYSLTRRLLIRAGGTPSLITVVCITIAGFLAEAQFGLFGSIRNDALCALAFLTALVLLLPEKGAPPNLKSLSLAALLMGSIMGMKLTNSVYVAGFAFAVMAIMPGWTARFRAAVICGGFGLLGLTMFGGPWAFVMYETYGNPMFPMMNSLFGAPLGPETAFRDTNFLPRSIGEGIIRPFLFLIDAKLIHEHDYFDLRFLMSYLSIPTIFGWIWIKARRGDATASDRQIVAICLGVLATIAVWTVLFSIGRYVIAVWVIGPTLLATLFTLIRPKLVGLDRAPLATAAAATALIISTQPADLRRTPWETTFGHYVDVDLPKGIDYENSFIIFAGGYPSAFMSSAFPEQTRLTHAVPQTWTTPALANYRPLIRDVWTKTHRDLYVIIVDTEIYYFQETLDRLLEEENMTVSVDKCRDIRHSLDSPEAIWKICPASINTQN